MLEKSLKSNSALSVKGYLTNSDKFNEPSKQLPPAGRGSSAQGLSPAYSKFSLFDNKL